MKLFCLPVACALLYYVATCHALGLPDFTDPASLVAWATDVMATFSSMETELKETKAELKDAKGQLQTTKAELRQTQQQMEERYSEQTQLDRSRVASQLSHPDIRSNPNCILGTRYGYEELPGVEIIGPSTPLNVNANSGAYECLYQCVITQDCVAVKISQSQQCSGLSSIDSQEANSAWNSYVMTHPDDCYISKQPPIMFQATITADTLMDVGVPVVWTEVRANTTSDLGPDGKFRCPVSGTYSFGMDAVTASSNSSYRVVLSMVHQDDTIKYLYAFHSDDLDFIPASCTAIVFCAAGEYVWVEAAAAMNFLEGYAYQTTFYGQLLTLKG